MFIVLQVTRRESHGIFDALMGILSRPKIFMEKRELLGVPYMLIQAESGRKGLDWERIGDVASELPYPVLLPEGVAFPADTHLRLFHPREFDHVVLFRTACELITLTRMPIYRRVLGLVDPDGRYCDMLEELLRHYSTVRVVTQSLSLYQDAADRMLQELGAPVLISDQLSSLGDCVLILSPDALSDHEDFRVPCPVLCIEPPDLNWQCEIFHGLRAGLPPGCEPLPEGLSPHLAMAALYELEGLRGVNNGAKQLYYNGRASTLEEAARSVLLMAGYSFADLQNV